jgi:hypothetical protein
VLDETEQWGKLLRLETRALISKKFKTKSYVAVVAAAAAVVVVVVVVVAVVVIVTAVMVYNFGFRG